VSETAPDRGPAPAADSTIALQPGARLGPIRLVRELGLGGQGVVYEAVRESDGLAVAAKILRTDVSLTDDQIERFDREAQAAQRLHHENIVAVFGVVEWQGFRVILQELVTGGSLDDAVKARHGQRERTNSDDCRWAAGICRQLALALQHAHENHVVHRDMKPGNVLLTPEGVPKITDFGLAKVEDLFGLTQTGDRMGTPNYMSPEQVEAARDGVDARTDIYSLAAVLYRMLSRRVPFQADKLSTLFRDILTRAPTPPRKLEPAVPRDLQAVCLKALQKSPADRYQTAIELADDLQRFLDGRSTLARPEGAIVRATRSLSHLALSTLAAVALLVPTIWLLIDLLLRRAAEGDLGLHTVRLAAVGLAALVLAWPLSLLGLRLSRGRRWTVAAAWAAALSLGGLGGSMVLDQRAGQVHRAERSALEHTVDFETLGERRDVDDLAGFASRWDDRLDAEDFRLLGRGYLKRLRPGQAEDWALRLEAASADSPDSHALMFAVADALGDDEHAVQAGEALWREPGPGEGWVEWSRAGDVLADVHRYDEARRAYVVASRRPDAEQGRDLLNLKLAQVSAGLCEYEKADSWLDDYIKWHEDDARANEVAIAIARNQQDWPSADEHLARLESGRRDTWATYVRNRFDLLTARGDSEAAQGFVDEVAGHEYSDFSVLDWCATQAYENRRYDVAAGIWQRMLQLKTDSAVPHIGLSNVDYRLAQGAGRDKDLVEARRLYQKSTDEAQLAIRLDPRFYQAYFNLYLSMQKTLDLERGAETGFSVADFASLLDPLRTTLRYNGLQPEALNAAAYIIARTVEKDASAASIGEAAGFMRRATRLIEREQAGDCRLTDADSLKLAKFYDTLRDVEEVKGDVSAALEAERRAVELLPPSETGRLASYGKVVEKLEAQLAGGEPAPPAGR